MSAAVALLERADPVDQERLAAELDMAGAYTASDPSKRTTPPPTPSTILRRRKPIPRHRTLTPTQQVRLFEPFMAQYIRRLRATRLRQSSRRRPRHRRRPGRDQDQFRRQRRLDYVAADGSYAPIETIQGNPSSADGQLINVFHAFEYLPAAGNAGLLSLIAQHPGAQIDRSLRDFRTAGNRLFPNG
jgi:hypothetical protein